MPNFRVCRINLATLKVAINEGALNDSKDTQKKVEIVLSLAMKDSARSPPAAVKCLSHILKNSKTRCGNVMQAKRCGQKT